MDLLGYGDSILEYDPGDDLQVHPVLSREIVEGEQRLSVFPRALGGLRVLRFVGRKEGIERPTGLRACGRNPDSLHQQLLRPLLEDFGPCVPDLARDPWVPGRDYLVVSHAAYLLPGER